MFSFKSDLRERKSSKSVKIAIVKTVKIPDFPSKCSAIKRPRDRTITENMSLSLLLKEVRILIAPLPFFANRDLLLIIIAAQD